MAEDPLVTNPPQSSGGFALMTPGSAVADQLQNILASQRLQKQQALLNDAAQQRIGIEQQNANTNQGYRENSAKSLELQRQGNEDYKEAQAQGIRDKATQHQGALTAMDTFMQSPEFAKLDPTIQTQFHAARVSGNDDLIKQVLGNMTKEQISDLVPMNEFDENSNTTKPAIDINGKPVMGKRGEILKRGFAPQPNATSMPSLFQRKEPDPNFPDDRTKDIDTSYWLHNGEVPNDKNKIPGPSLRKGNEAVLRLGGTTVGAPLYQDKDVKAFQSALTSQSPGAADARNLARQNIVNNITTPYKGMTPQELAARKLVQEDVKAIYNNETARKMSVDDLVKNGILSGDPQHIKDVATILNVIKQGL